MPEDRQQEPYVEELRSNAPVFAVAPVRQRTRVPRVALVGLVVGVAAFVAGIGVASSGPTVRAEPPVPPPVASPAASGGTVAASVAEPPTPVPSVTAASPRPSPVAPGTSSFLAAFDPAAIVTALPGGSRCTAAEPLDKEVPRTRRDGPRLTFQRSWLIWCPIPAAGRQAFILDAFEGLVDEIPADTFGYSAGIAGTGDALFPYAEQSLAGNVALTAGAAGRGLAIAVVVAEWRPDPDL